MCSAPSATTPASPGRKKSRPEARRHRRGQAHQRDRHRHPPPGIPPRHRGDHLHRRRPAHPAQARQVPGPPRRPLPVRRQGQPAEPPGRYPPPPRPRDRTPSAGLRRRGPQARPWPQGKAFHLGLGPAQPLPRLPQRRTGLRRPARNHPCPVRPNEPRGRLRSHQPRFHDRLPGAPAHPQPGALDRRGHAPCPRLDLRRGPKPRPRRPRAPEPLPPPALRHRAHPGARAPRRRNHAAPRTQSPPRPRLPQDDRQHQSPNRTRTRLSAPPGYRPRTTAPPCGRAGAAPVRMGGKTLAGDGRTAGDSPMVVMSTAQGAIQSIITGNLRKNPRFGEKRTNLPWEHPRDDPGTDHFPTVCGSRNLPGAARRAYCRDW